MITKWLRESFIASFLLLAVRLYLGWDWMHHGWVKITGGTFDATGFIKNAVNKPVADSKTKEVLYPTFTSFLDNFALPNANLFKILIPWGEFLVGLGLLLGTLTAAAAFFAVLMNFMFMFAGTVSSNPWLLLLGFIIILGSSNSGRWGGDYYVLPYLRRLFKLDRIGRAPRT